MPDTPYPQQLRTQEKADLLLRMAIEASTIARHHETVRAAVSASLLALAAALLAALAFAIKDAPLVLRSWFVGGIGVVLILIGWLGFSFARASYDRWLVWHKSGFSLLERLDEVLREGGCHPVLEIFNRNVHAEMGRRDVGKASDESRDHWLWPMWIVMGIGAVAVGLAWKLPDYLTQ